MYPVVLSIAFDGVLVLSDELVAGMAVPLPSLSLSGAVEGSGRLSVSWRRPLLGSHASGLFGCHWLSYLSGSGIGLDVPR